MIINNQTHNINYKQAHLLNDFDTFVPVSINIIYPKIMIKFWNKKLDQHVSDYLIGWY